MITRDEAFELLKKYNKDPFHIQHALTVEAVMKWYAKELGYSAEEDHWGIVGLLHDIERGSAQLGWELEKLLTMTLQAMQACEDTINQELAAEQVSA